MWSAQIYYTSFYAYSKYIHFTKHILDTICSIYCNGYLHYACTGTNANMLVLLAFFSGHWSHGTTKDCCNWLCCDWLPVVCSYHKIISNIFVLCSCPYSSVLSRRTTRSCGVCSFIGYVLLTSSRLSSSSSHEIRKNGFSLWVFLRHIVSWSFSCCWSAIGQSWFQGHLVPFDSAPVLRLPKSFTERSWPGKNVVRSKFESSWWSQHHGAVNCNATTNVSIS